MFVLAAIWVLAVFTEAQAQGKGQEKEKNKSEKDKKKNERVVDKEKAKSAKAKIKYRPRAMTNDDLTEWTDGNPPGWSQGEKTGWQGAGAPPGQIKNYEREILRGYPPGSEDWDTRRKAAWDSKLEQSRVRILERIRTRERTSPEDEKSAMLSIEGAAREGVPLGNAEATINKAIARGMRGRDIEKVTRAMSYGADKGTDYNSLNQFVETKMNEGEAGNDLALSIYKEIDEQHAARLKTPVKKSWWKRLFGG